MAGRALRRYAYTTAAKPPWPVSELYDHAHADLVVAKASAGAARGKGFDESLIRRHARAAVASPSVLMRGRKMVLPARNRFSAFLNLTSRALYA